MFSSIIVEVIVGIAIAGPVYAPSRAGLGRPVWGPPAFLQDLELRLGLPPAREVERERLQLWTAHLRARIDAGAPPAFYAQSLATDELGTAALLLAWRDRLVEAGWNGEPIGVSRIDQLAQLENGAPETMPLGIGDRLARVEAELGRLKARIYERVRSLDDLEAWPGRWRRVFRRLGELGTSVEREIVTNAFPHLPRAAPTSDLEWLQARLGGDPRPPHIRGDGSLLVLRSDTPADLAELTAAMLASLDKRGRARTVVARPRDPALLDAALSRYGLATQGNVGRSPWRPAMQLLALVLELAFEPRDPYRVLELLTLPVGPFRGLLGAKLARAVARQPGVGGKEWQRQKADATARLRAQAANDPKAAHGTELRIERIKTWLERPGAHEHIRRAELQSVVERVQGWLSGRLTGDESALYAPAYAQAAAFADALRNDARNEFAREDVRQLFDTFARSELDLELTAETTGRIPHVAHPNSILEPVESLFIWNFVIGLEPSVRRLPWSPLELHELDAKEVFVPQPTALLRATNDGWRRAIFATEKRVVLVVPSTIQGVPSPIHPFWDEIQARLSLDESGVARITRTTRDILTRGQHLVPTTSLNPLALPSGRATWTAPADLLIARDGTIKTSVTALERITACPLSWVLEHRAGVTSGAMSKVARGGLLSGNLAHRLVEVLHYARAFELDEEAFLTAADAQLEELIRVEGATLLLSGAAVERLQLCRQLRSALRSLYRYLRDSGFRIAAVEEEISVSSAIGPLHGRIDLRLVDESGRVAILDLKWGGSRFEELLMKGRSIQLAAYSRALGGDPPAGYFTLKRGRLLTTSSGMRGRVLDGPSLTDTWEKVEATALSVLDSHERGTIHVAAARTELPLLDAMGIPASARDRYYEAPPGSACEYCDYDAICGRKWRNFS